MLKGGVIMDVVTPDQAKVAEDAGTAAVMALERVPADIRRDGGVARDRDRAGAVGRRRAQLLGQGHQRRRDGSCVLLLLAAIDSDGARIAAADLAADAAERAGGSGTRFCHGAATSGSPVRAAISPRLLRAASLACGVSQGVGFSRA